MLLGMQISINVNIQFLNMCPEALNHQARLDDVEHGALLLTSPAELRPLWEQFYVGS